MIVVKIEMWRHGERRRSEEIGRLYIRNMEGDVFDSRGDYEVKVCRKGSFTFHDSMGWERIKAVRTTIVRDYPRLSYNVWRLIMRGLRGAFPEEKDDRGTVAQLLYDDETTCETNRDRDPCGFCAGCTVAAERTEAGDQLEAFEKLEPRSFPVTDPDLDAPDGAVVGGFERTGDRWDPVT